MSIRQTGETRFFAIDLRIACVQPIPTKGEQYCGFRDNEHLCELEKNNNNDDDYADDNNNSDNDNGNDDDYNIINSNKCYLASVTCSAQSADINEDPSESFFFDKIISDY